MNFPDRGDVDALIDPQPLPDFARVQYEPETAAVDDPSAAARTELDRLDFDGLEPGATVAVAVGSRGIHRIDDIVETVVADIRDRGFEPVVVPAMGSHGGATPRASAKCWRAWVSRSRALMPPSTPGWTLHRSTPGLRERARSSCRR